MGLSIHYKGCFSKGASLQAMIEEVTDIAEIYKWKYSVYETAFDMENLGRADFNNRIYGIIFVAPKCEPVYLSFLSNGRMSNEMHLQHRGNSTDKSKYLYMLSTKTQYGGMQVHLTIIQMLRYLSEKYFSEFELYDEGGYWETGDVNILAETFKRYDDLMDAVAGALAERERRPRVPA